MAEASSEHETIRRKHFADLDRLAELERANRELTKRNRHLEEENKALTEKAKELTEEAKELKEETKELKEETKELKEETKELKAQLARARTTSRNSSKRPSSDIVKPPAARGKSGRKIGGQPGHPKHGREPFAANELDRHLCYTLNCCPDCHGALRACADMPPKVIQQLELTGEPVEKREHRAPWQWCEHCQKAHCAMPPEVEKAGLCGPVLTAWIAYLKGSGHESFSTIRRFVRDVLGVRVSRGLLAKAIAKASAALAEPWEELRTLLPLAEILNVDETGHKENGQRLWTWCYRAREYSVFKIAETRGTAELPEMLGADFDGVIGCDYFSSYRCYMREFGGVMQFCLAHFIREVKFLLELPDELTRRWGQRLLERLRGLFQIVHRRSQWTPPEFQRRLDAQRREILRVASDWVPSRPEAILRLD